MKILFLGNDSPDLTEPIRGILNGERLKMMLPGHEVRLISPALGPRSRGGGARALCIGGIRARFLRGWYGRLRWQSVRAAVWRLAATWVPDVVLSGWDVPDGEGAVPVSRVLGVPAVMILGGSHLPAQAPRTRSAVLRALGGADAIVALGGDAARELTGLGIDPTKVSVVPLPGCAGTRAGGDAVPVPAPDWKRFAEDFSAALRPLAPNSEDSDGPRWATWAPVPSGGIVIRRSLHRQLVRRAMELLPSRLFLTHAPRHEKKMYLTFDDGPHPEHTPRVLDELARLGVPATFFVVGRQVLRHPDLIRRMVAEGHAVANHTFLHSDLRLLSAPEAVFGADALRQLLREVLGSDIRLYRPPRGKVRPAQALALWKAGYTIVLWSADARDWACESAEQVTTWARHHPFEPGDIVLMHDRLPFASIALPELVSAAHDLGLRFEALEEPRPRPSAANPRAS